LSAENSSIVSDELENSQLTIFISQGELRRISYRKTTEALALHLFFDYST